MRNKESNDKFAVIFLLILSKKNGKWFRDCVGLA